MPRGRHRHSPPLHRMLPPVAVAGASALCAVGSWTLVDPVMLRTLVVAAAAAAGTGAVMMRLWDREAGRQVADLTRARAHDAWQSEERIAELETDVEDSRELRAKLDAKLRAKRVELAALRGEHAALLRRYATAETERAGALEERRQLTIEVAMPKGLAQIGSAPTADVFLRARKALEDLTDSAAAQRQAAEAGVQDATEPPADVAEATDVPEAVAEGHTDAVSEDGSPEADPEAEADEPVEEEPVEPVEMADETDGPPQEPAAEIEAEHSRPAVVPARRASAAKAVAPYGPRRLPEPRPESGFNFFGAQRAAGTVPPQREGAPTAETEPGSTAAVPPAGDGSQSGPAALSLTLPQQTASATTPPGRAISPGRGADRRGAVESGVLDDVQQEDLADVVGEETLAAQRADPARAVGDVIDLAVHEEPQQERVPVGKLRKAVSS
ncbi:hypothetical protein [Streptomyces sp. NPDC005953]|uniref:hypothetical protein n=1 Tax=Streptomyces sp. NPDC005953 TaxID=3156719 RepID=UPI0033E3FDD4